jgi:GntR family transcriptional regulator
MNAAHPAKPLPVYLQIAELLARQIKAGYWHSGERLPTEAELAQTLSVAVGTLRKSLALLEEQGVLERIQGSGTYVRQTAGSQQIYELFRLELSNGPGLPTAHILDLSLQPRPAALAAITREGEPCWRVRRLRFLSQQPVALEEIWFSASDCPDLPASKTRSAQRQRRIGQCNRFACKPVIALAISSAYPGRQAIGWPNFQRPGSILRCAGIPHG